MRAIPRPAHPPVRGENSQIRTGETCRQLLILQGGHSCGLRACLSVGVHVERCEVELRWINKSGTSIIAIRQTDKEESCKIVLRCDRYLINLSLFQSGQYIKRGC